VNLIAGIVTKNWRGITLHDKPLFCHYCPLYEAPGMLFGETYKGTEDSIEVVFIAEALGRQEVEKKRTLIGRAGTRHRYYMRRSGISNAYLTNVVKCRPPNNRDPSKEEIEYCMFYLDKQLKKFKPKVIVTVGGISTFSLVETDLSITNCVGKVFSNQYCDVVIPVFHPSYLLRNRGNKELHNKQLMTFKNIHDHLEKKSTVARKTYVQVADGKIEKKNITAEDMEGKDEEFLWPASKKYGRKYFAGFSERHNINLLYRDDNNEKRIETVKSKELPDNGNVSPTEWYGWYFLVRKKDYDSLRMTRKKIINSLIQKANGRILPCPISKEYYRIYTKFDYYSNIYNKITGRELIDAIYVRNEKPVTASWAKKRKLWTGTIKVSAGGAGGVRVADTAMAEYDKKVTFNDSQKKILDIVKKLEVFKIPFYEADLTPRQRFITDHDLFIENDLRGLFFDFETDDTISGFENIEENRVVSVAFRSDYYDEDPDYFIGRKYKTTDKDSDKDRIERTVLKKFRDVIERHEIIYAWNGFNFDFPILRARFKKHGIDYDWDRIVWCDLLAVWRRYFQRGASVNTSFSLDNIAFHVLKKRKLDRGKKKIIELYQGNKEDRKLLLKYNKRDVELLYELEEFTGFAKIDQTFCRIGNCFPQDYHISTKIDGLMLKKGRRNGIHFPTRKYHPRSRYTGALVLDPKVGLHEGVANFDFASLYPTMMTTFNISPDTFIPASDLEKYEEDEFVTCPSGASFKNDKLGYIPQMFSHTLEKRKKYTTLQKKEEVGSDMFLLYYRLAYSFKRLGLSFYGELGNNRSRFYNPILAEAVTLSGQHFLKYTMDLADKEGYIPLYGDTDSMFIKLSKEDAEKFEGLCNKHFADYCKKNFGARKDWCNISLEYENYFDRIFFVTKKRYAGLMKMYKGQEADYIEVKGLEMMRSDGLEYMRRLQEDVIGKVLREEYSPEDLYVFLKQEQEKVFSLELDGEAVTITQSVSKSPDAYKTRLAHVAIAKWLIKNGKEFYKGMKVPYIVIASKPRITAVHPSIYKEKEYDSVYYWNKKIFPTIERIVETVYPDFGWDQLLLDNKLKKKIEEK
jgi:DNA polymerase I